jgi:predicted SnoaL-like aldol condensation-catalyzing enzyme
MLSGCQSKPYSYTANSIKQAQAITGAPYSDALAKQVASNFVGTFEALGTPDFFAKADKLFADTLYLNDTLAEHYNKQSLNAYFVGMNKRVTNSKVTILQQYHQGDVLYLHWTMGFNLRVLGKQVAMFSAGITQLKVNAAGQVVYQQDYWDPNNGLYRQLPVVGWLYRKLLPLH